jgi:hypothetical protein
VLVKNINSTHRVDGITSQFGLAGALAASRADMKTWVKNNAVEFPSVAAQ